MNKILLIIAVLFLIKVNVYAQSEGIQLGSNLNQLRTTPAGGYYDYSDPQAVNIKVAVWGWVRFPGKYIIPSYCNVNDLLSYAGGPTDAAHLEDLKLMRMGADSSQTLIDIKYKDIVVENDVKSLIKAPQLKPGDVLVVSGEPRLYFTNYFSIVISTISALVSVATLVYLIVKK